MRYLFSGILILSCCIVAGRSGFSWKILIDPGIVMGMLGSMCLVFLLLDLVAEWVYGSSKENPPRFTKDDITISALSILYGIGSLIFYFIKEK